MKPQEDEREQIIIKFDHEPTIVGIIGKMAEVQDRITRMFLEGKYTEKEYLKETRIMLDCQMLGYQHRAGNHKEQ